MAISKAPCAQQGAVRGVKLHLPARIAVGSGRDSSESLAHAAETLLDTRQLSPKVHRGNSQRDAD